MVITSLSRAHVQEPPWPSPETMISVSVFSYYFLKYCSFYLSVAETGSFLFIIVATLNLIFLYIYPISSSSAESKMKRRWSLVHLGGIKVLHVNSWSATDTPATAMTTWQLLPFTIGHCGYHYRHLDKTSLLFVDFINLKALI